MDRWVGKVAVVTGASAGIGQNLVEKLTEEGLQVVGLARRVERVEEAAKKLSGKRGKLHAVKCDVSSEEEVKKAFQWVQDNLGPVSILINNAGVIRVGAIDDSEPSAWKEILDINVFGTALCTQQAIKQMKAANIDGHIINVNSIAGYKVIDSLDNKYSSNLYAPSKHAITAFTEVVRQELKNAGTKIKVTVVGLARRVERVEEAAKKLSGKRGKLHAVKCDVSSEEEVKKAFQWVQDNLGPVSILINNAGVIRVGAIDDEINSTHIKEENKKYDHYSQQLENDNADLNYLQVDESSSSSNDRTQNDKNVGSYDVVDIDKLPKKEKRFKCSHCDKTFEKQRNLEVHTRVHMENKPYKCSTCQKAFLYRFLLNTHKLSHASEKPYECDVCHKTFAARSTLTTHSRIHTGVKPFKCLTCQKTFLRSSQLKVHEAIHTGEKPHECDICHKSFISRSKLVLHTRVHTGEKPFECSTCQKTFTQAGLLNRHVLTHSDEKPHECDICQKTFVTRSTLVLHTRVHTREKPFECVICQKTFAQYTSLKIHESTHTGEKPHKCDVCHKSFITRSKLLYHIRVHTGERPFECLICHKTFTQNGLLNSHKVMHSDEKPYECVVCQKTFARRGNLISHSRVHTR